MADGQHPLEQPKTKPVKLSDATKAMIEKKHPSDTCLQVRHGEKVATFPVEASQKTPIKLDVYVRAGGREFTIQILVEDRGATGHPHYEASVQSGAHSFIVQGARVAAAMPEDGPVLEDGYIMGSDGVPIRASLASLRR